MHRRGNYDESQIVMKLSDFFKPRENAESAWRFVGVNYDEKEFLIDGINVFAHGWRDVAGEIAQVSDPLYEQARRFSVYEITENNRTVKFAAGEFSNGVWGFYVPQ